MVKLDLAARDLKIAVLGRNDVRLLEENLVQAIERSLGHRKRNDQKGHHHQRGDDLRGIAHQRSEIADVQPGARIHHLHAAEREQHKRAGPHDAELDRTGERKELLRVDLRLLQIVGRGVELADLMVFAHKRFDHAGRNQVFLHRAVHRIILFQHDLKPRKAHPDHHKHQNGNDRDRKHKNQRQVGIDAKRHDRRKDHHQRRADKDAEQLLIDVLQVVHVRGRAHDQRRGLEPVGVAKRKGLDFLKDHMPQVLGKPHARDRACPCRQRTERKRQQRGHNHQTADPKHKLEIILDRQPRKQLFQLVILFVIQTAVHDRRHQKRDHDLEHDLADHQQRREQRDGAVPLGTRQQGAQPLDWLVLLHNFTRIL